MIKSAGIHIINVINVQMYESNIKVIYDVNIDI